MKIRYDNSREEIDVGCIYADNCFECPFSDCICRKEEMEIQGEELEQRRSIVRADIERVRNLKKQGMKTSDIADVIGLPEVVVRRYLYVIKQQKAGKKGC